MAVLAAIALRTAGYASRCLTKSQTSMAISPPQCMVAQYKFATCENSRCGSSRRWTASSLGRPRDRSVCQIHHACASASLRPPTARLPASCHSA